MTSRPYSRPAGFGGRTDLAGSAPGRLAHKRGQARGRSQEVAAVIIMRAGELKQGKQLEEDVSIHIFTVSSAMVGACLSVIGLIRVVITLRKCDTIADDLLAMDAVLFLLATLLSYWALRRRSYQRRPLLERTADTLFILALLFMAFG